ncbi:DUF1674 domain-containing protein [Mesorhizobium sp.]|uniref:DUF1674 domain-containing protein n=1 Tax=Mesorhizobium sp. TaxID=1871066 RepID=UPI000FE790F0|nr:DUF1674 domain-containing protein [Mesorhizobium sp.]RWK64286.1 MAG: DUF1674 domain-containing protein [Mesorhizobium sp.]RWM52094.1 MAG: DUF1674 domain-containing protein [Mesorhizobium sp.]RWM55309.1 MAG: DUF1674 domain-containing protein [Mesorhizobium sp.]RWM55927.1 MAG: DUF1674 domain-containing protein [Mesorhizobium sp.]RWM77415.1 MAG: DUF1674 domain-containing protein [Mesorhizobium sp.]
MIDETNKTGDISGHDASRKTLTPAARRALAEAEARRDRYRQQEAAMPQEIGGRGGKEPGRYGDWEVKGLTSDF